jgi:hypothetical protein
MKEKDYKIKVLKEFENILKNKRYRIDESIVEEIIADLYSKYRDEVI